jgi:amidohydrolase
MTRWTDLADELLPQMIATRRDLHQHPELAFQEVRTAGMIAERLHGLGLDVRTGVGQTGVVGVLEGKADGPTVLIRADMDALPIEEQTGLDYRSTVPGKMHACGHDAHVAIALGVASALSAQREHLRGHIKFVFQPAEEIGQGAQAMIDAGVLDDPRPTVALGLHVWNELPVGQVVVTPGPIMAGGDRFEVTIRGRGGHAALPHRNLDPLPAVGHILLGLQSIVSRSIAPEDIAVVSVTQVEAGHAFNVTPQEARLVGTIRTFRREVTEVVHQRFREIVTHAAESQGCTADIRIDILTTPVVNDAAHTQALRTYLQAELPQYHYHDHFTTMVGEDFAAFLNRVPGTFLLVGSAPAGEVYPHHHPQFAIDEQVLADGAALMLAAVGRLVLTVNP